MTQHASNTRKRIGSGRLRGRRTPPAPTADRGRHVTSLRFQRHSSAAPTPRSRTTNPRVPSSHEDPDPPGRGRGDHLGTARRKPRARRVRGRGRPHARRRTGGLPTRGAGSRAARRDAPRRGRTGPRTRDPQGVGRPDRHAHRPRRGDRPGARARARRRRLRRQALLLARAHRSDPGHHAARSCSGSEDPDRDRGAPTRPILAHPHQGRRTRSSSPPASSTCCTS